MFDDFFVKLSCVFIRNLMILFRAFLELYQLNDLRDAKPHQNG